MGKIWRGWRGREAEAAFFKPLQLQIQEPAVFSFSPDSRVILLEFLEVSTTQSVLWSTFRAVNENSFRQEVVLTLILMPSANPNTFKVNFCSTESHRQSFSLTFYFICALKVDTKHKNGDQPRAKATVIKVDNSTYPQSGNVAC